MTSTLPSSNIHHKEVQVQIKLERKDKEVQANLKPHEKRKGANCIIKYAFFYTLIRCAS